MTRTIEILTSNPAGDARRVDAYLYSNFARTAIVAEGDRHKIVVTGEDRAGFTAEALAARLGSGLLAAKVVA